MTTSRVITAAAVLALVAGTGVADAATRRKPAPPKPICKLIQDPKDDATETIATTGPNDPALDILSADIVTNATHITVVWRLSNLAGAQTSWPAGRGYQLDYKVQGKGHSLIAVVAPSGQLWQNGQGKGNVDSVKNEVHMTVPISAMTVKFKPGEKLTELMATSWRMGANTQNKLGRADTANTVAPHAYQSGYPACVKVEP